MKHRLLALICGCSMMIHGVATAGVEEKSQDGLHKDIPYGTIDQKLIPFAYSGTERFTFEVAYTGGIKLGELHLEIRSIPGAADDYELYALVTTEDTFFNNVYPVRDVHVTKVKGRERLPYFYEVWQKEGYSYEAHKQISYNQVSGQIRYQKNENAPIEYNVGGTIHNEFSSFFSSRLMAMEIGKSFLVPTFADKRRVEVEVKVLGKDYFKKTAIGSVDTVEVSPILKFKGLYDKRGDTTIWYTNDECRVPVKITSKLAIGSITSTLLSYDNPACSRYTQLAKLEK